MNIATRMREAVPLLRRQGTNNVRLPDVREESSQEWSDDYAIVQDAYPDPDYEFYSENTVAEFCGDLEKWLRDFFGAEPVIKVYRQSNEIEIHKPD